MLDNISDNLDMLTEIQDTIRNGIDKFRDIISSGIERYRK